VGIRRNFSNVSAASLGAVILDDISQQTVNRAELVTGGALQACMKAFHRQNEVLAQMSDTLVVAGHSYASDATNSSVWRQSKLQGLCLSSVYVHDPAKISEVVTQ
jgi:hypothetical protein